VGCVVKNHLGDVGARASLAPLLGGRERVKDNLTVIQRHPALQKFCIFAGAPPTLCWLRPSRQIPRPAHSNGKRRRGVFFLTPKSGPTKRPGARFWAPGPPEKPAGPVVCFFFSVAGFLFRPIPSTSGRPRKPSPPFVTIKLCAAEPKINQGFGESPRNPEPRFRWPPEKQASN